VSREPADEKVFVVERFPKKNKENTHIRDFKTTKKGAPGALSYG
jgi:hypothetical protein